MRHNGTSGSTVKSHSIHTMVSSLLLISLLLSGCSIDPRYQVPSVPIVPAYKEASDTVWKAAEPQDSVLRGNWWELFHDQKLDELEARIDGGNQNIAAAISNYAAARAVVAQTRSQYFPSVSTTPSITNSRIAAVPYTATSNGITYMEYSFPVTASWEPDLWARVRKTVQASAYAAQASAADLENVRLLAHANLAGDYFELRNSEAQLQLLKDTIASWQSYLDLTRGLHKSGLESEEAVAAAESQLKSTQAQEATLLTERAQYEHAIAVLVGESPSTFSLPITSDEIQLPRIPAALPAMLMERRPDIAAAERNMAAANAQIGIAKTAFFPNVVLSATGGIESLSIADWFTWPSRLWSVGPSVTQAFFDAGLRKATVRQYQEMYNVSVADYRQATLTGFQQVEDNLAALRALKDGIQKQDAAVQASGRYLQEARARYSAGLDPYLNVINAQVSVLSYQQALVTLQTQQKIASLQLIEALGGGWESTQLPSVKQVGRERANTH